MKNDLLVSNLDETVFVYGVLTANRPDVENRTTPEPQCQPPPRNGQRKALAPATGKVSSSRDNLHLAAFDGVMAFPFFA